MPWWKEADLIREPARPQLRKIRRRPQLRKLRWGPQRRKPWRGPQRRKLRRGPQRRKLQRGPQRRKLRRRPQPRKLRRRPQLNVKWAPKGERGNLEKPNGLCPSRVPQGGAKPPTSRNERGMIAVLGDALEGVVAVYTDAHLPREGLSPDGDEGSTPGRRATLALTVLMARSRLLPAAFERHDAGPGRRPRDGRSLS